MALSIAAETFAASLVLNSFTDIFSLLELLGFSFLSMKLLNLQACLRCGCFKNVLCLHEANSLILRIHISLLCWKLFFFFYYFSDIFLPSIVWSVSWARSSWLLTPSVAYKNSSSHSSPVVPEMLFLNFQEHFFWGVIIVFWWLLHHIVGFFFLMFIYFWER